MTAFTFCEGAHHHVFALLQKPSTLSVMPMNTTVASIILRVLSASEELKPSTKLLDLCNQVAATYGNQPIGYIVYLALSAWPNDAQDWAEEQLK